MTVGAAAPLISVIVPVYNAAGSLHRSLRSVLGQTLPDFELIVIDDCSTDESANILEVYRVIDDRVRIFSTNKNSGPGVARNVGLKNARGKFIAFLDSDDFWMSNKLERQIRSFDNDEVILSYTSTILLNPEGNILGIINGRQRVYAKHMRFANRVPMSSAMFRKELNGAEQMPGIRSRQDYAYWLTLLRKNNGYVAGVPDELVGYVRMPGSVSSNAWRNVVHTFRMYMSEVDMGPLQAAAAVAAFSCLKVRKELMARISWLCLPEKKRRQLQMEIEACWNHGGKTLDSKEIAL